MPRPTITTTSIARISANRVVARTLRRHPRWERNFTNIARILPNMSS